MLATFRVLLLAAVGLVTTAVAQQSDTRVEAGLAPPDGTSPVTTKQQPPPAPPAHKFWDRENVLLFSGVAVFRALDYTSTKNMLARGREEILIPNDVVDSQAGFPALEAAGVAASVGISYIFHRTGHHKMERWVSIVHIGVTGFGAARNYSLKSKHP